MLNERQKRLYQFLLENSETNKFISKEEICTNLQELYPRHNENSTEHSSRAFALIRRDVRAINSSDVYKIIASNKQGYKIATKAEALAYVDKRFARDLKSLKLNWNLRNKLQRNGQIQIVGDDLYKEIRTFLEKGESDGTTI